MQSEKQSKSIYLIIKPNRRKKTNELNLDPEEKNK